MKSNKTDIQVLLRAKIRIYPEYVHRDKYVKGVLTYKANHWYLVVDNNGMLTMYDKPLGRGKVLPGKNLIDPVEKTAKFWRQKVDNIKKTNEKQI